MPAWNAHLEGGLREEEEEEEGHEEEAAEDHEQRRDLSSMGGTVKIREGQVIRMSA